ncbi:MAG: DUF4347 domain-containing protein [Desulforhopalus sp.]|jgi:hypothetical protein|nr:DUF4347 domain-containing protein [Desulforhopalus sp.]
MASKRTDIDRLFLYDPGEYVMRKQAEYFAGRSGKHAKAPIRGIKDVVNALSPYSQLKWLHFNTHGMPGKIYFERSPNTITVGNLHALCESNKALGDNARILFHGCNIGESGAGSDFITVCGRYLLKEHGGFVGASTGMMFAGFFSLFGLSDQTYRYWGKLRIYQFDKLGDVIRQIAR